MSQPDPSRRPCNHGVMQPLDGTGRVTRSGTYGANFATIPPGLIKASKYPPGVFAGTGLISPAEQVRRLIAMKEDELAELRTWLARHDGRPAASPPPAAPEV